MRRGCWMAEVLPLPQTTERHEKGEPVRVMDFDITFGAMAELMFKAIGAFLLALVGWALILGLVFAGVVMLFAGLGNTM